MRRFLFQYGEYIILIVLQEEIKKIKEKDVIGMYLKYHGRNVSRFYCKKCLMAMYGWDNDKWDSEVKKFKEQGCTLF